MTDADAARQRASEITNNLVERIYRLARGDLSDVREDENTPDKMVPAVFWPRRWLIEAVAQIAADVERLAARVRWWELVGDDWNRLVIRVRSRAESAEALVEQLREALEKMSDVVNRAADFTLNTQPNDSVAIAQAKLLRDLRDSINNKVQSSSTPAQAGDKQQR